mmetsp:Transcript_56987/g.102007  ORF Transcript_56987/g.102007 Transcript_56987/m.102007 type:complete len:375 (-) Transcript_56987:25-1149(-)
MCKWYCTSEGPSTNLKCLNCGCHYCGACLHGEAGKMSSLTKCARCGKKPTVRSNADRGAWKDVVQSAESVDCFSASDPPPVLDSDATFTSSLRPDAAKQDNPSSQPRGKARPKTTPRVDGVFSRLTDTSSYTGAHKHRFDETGRGLGREGRDCISKGVGHLPPSGMLPKDDAHQPGHEPIPSDHCSPETAVEFRKASAQASPQFQPPPREPKASTVSHAQSESEPQASGLSTSRDDVTEAVFAAYCSGKSNMDGRAFTKVCKDCKLFDKNFTQVDADLLFSKVVPKGQRRIEFAHFSQALTLVANKKHVNVSVVLDAVASSRGPALTGTVAESVRFHDDKSSYTGVHAKGGPESVAKGLGSTSQLAAVGMKRGV